MQKIVPNYKKMKTQLKIWLLWQFIKNAYIIFGRHSFPMFPFGDLSGGNSEEFCELDLRKLHCFTQCCDVFDTKRLFRFIVWLFREFRESVPPVGLSPLESRLQVLRKHYGSQFFTGDRVLFFAVQDRQFLSGPSLVVLHQVCFRRRHNRQVPAAR